ncbi:MAG: DNA repair protein RadC, partial [Nitrospinota bacterium]
PEDDRPRERLIRHGASSLTDTELLAISLRVGNSSTGMSAIDLARAIVDRFGGLDKLDQLSIDELCSIKGMGPAKAAQLKGSFELGRRLMSGSREPKKRVGGSCDVASYYIPQMKDLKKEVFKIILLNIKNEILKDVKISEGCLTASIVHPREVFNPAITSLAASVILIHNHPSGDPAPSREDTELTQRLVKSGDMLGIKVIDHVIIGDNKYYSFLDEGRI